MLSHVQRQIIRLIIIYTLQYVLVWWTTSILCNANIVYLYMYSRMFVCTYVYTRHANFCLPSVVDVGKTVRGRHYMSINQVVHLCSEVRCLMLNCLLKSLAINHGDMRCQGNLLKGSLVNSWTVQGAAFFILSFPEVHWVWLVEFSQFSVVLFLINNVWMCLPFSHTCT